MTLLLCITGALLAGESALMGIESASVRTIQTDGSVVHKRVDLRKLGNDATQLTIKKEDIGSDVKCIEVCADGAWAKNGEPGFWPCNRGTLGHFISDKGFFTTGKTYLSMPYYAMQTERETFIGIIGGMRFECEVIVNAQDGNYSMYPRWDISGIGFAPYEDIVITNYKLPLKADYNEMAKAYRRHKLASDPDVKPMKERFKTQPLLEQNAKALSFRIRFGEKVLPDGNKKIDYTHENEPRIKSPPFSDGAKFLKEIKAAGIDNAFVNIEGWQNGGWGGRTPSIWPLCEEAGGEKEFIDLVKTGQSMGYLMDVHMYYTDQYTCSPQYNPEMTCRTPDGKMAYVGCWAGGRAYSLCLRYAWEEWIPAELDKIKRELGIEGGMFFDVFGACTPYRCCDPKHPANRKEVCQYHKQILGYARSLFGAVGQECGFDDNVGQVDFVYYPSTGFKDAVRTEDDPVGGLSLRYGIVPFFELVYHDIAMSSPYRLHFPPDFFLDTTQVDKRLRLAEYCGRVCLYRALETSIDDIKEADRFYKRYVHLIPEEMIHHTRIAEGVFKTDFGNGESIITNYGQTPFAYGKTSVPAKDFIVVKEQ